MNAYGLGPQRRGAQWANAAGQAVRGAMPMAGAVGLGLAAAGAGMAGAKALYDNTIGKPNPYQAYTGAEQAARFQAQGMGGALEGDQQLQKIQAQDNYLRQQRQLDMEDQWGAMQRATELTRNMQRDTAAQAFAEGAAMTRLNQDYGRESDIRRTKAQQASELMQGYLQGRAAAQQFAQGAFRSLI